MVCPSTSSVFFPQNTQNTSEKGVQRLTSCELVIYAISQLTMNTKYAFVILDEKATFNEKLCSQGM